MSLVSELAFEAIGTHWKISLPAHNLTPRLQKAIADRIEQFDAHYSRFRADSLVSAMAQIPGSYTLPEDAKPMLDLYRELYRITKGKMTPLIGSALSEAGYDATYSLTPGIVHAPPPWDMALSYDFPTLTITAPVLLDFGAAGKGYLIDIIGELLEAQGVHSYIINAGGDIRYRHHTHAALSVGLENPFNTTEAIGVASLSNESICGSAGNRRSWGDFHHILDPHTITSPKHISAVWVVAATTLLADALTTALYFAEPAALNKEYAFDYLILRPDYSIERSADFPAELFTA